jgi:hypothetical protein
VRTARLAAEAVVAAEIGDRVGAVFGGCTARRMRRAWLRLEAVAC